MDDLNPRARQAAHKAFDSALGAVEGQATIMQCIGALNDALQAYTKAMREDCAVQPCGHWDRRIVTDRRIAGRAKKAQEMADAITIVVVPPENKAAQVERVYELVPYDKRVDSGLTYEHVRLTLDALR